MYIQTATWNSTSQKLIHQIIRNMNSKVRVNILNALTLLCSFLFDLAMYEVVCWPVHFSITFWCYLWLFEKNATADVNASSKYPNEFFLRILKLNYNYNLKIKKKLKVHEFSNYARSRW